MKKVAIIIGIIGAIALAFYLYVRSLLNKLVIDFKIGQYTVGNEDATTFVGQVVGAVAGVKEVDITLFISSPITYLFKNLKLKIYYKDKLIFKQQNQNGFDVPLEKGVITELTEVFLLIPSNEAFELATNYFSEADVQVQVKISAMFYGFRIPITKKLTVNINDNQ